MSQEHEIIQLVYKAKKDNDAADSLIESYMNFIKSEVVKFLNRPIVLGQDDELSIAMMAFHEAILAYSSDRGSFISYAALIIRNRLYDYYRKEKKHRSNISLDATVNDTEVSLIDTISDDKDEIDEQMSIEATKAEIDELSIQMEEFGIGLSDVADNCPKQKRTLETCRKLIQYAKDNPELIDEFLKSKKLPLAKLCEGSGTERKTIERHRKYIVALLLIYSNGYEIIRGHLRYMMKGGS